jgi:hypothetical protein
MSQQQQHVQPSNERQIYLALQALIQDAKLSLRRAAAIYNVDRTTLGQRRDGRPSQADRRPKSMNLTKLEEDVVTEHVLTSLSVDSLPGSQT